MLEVWRMGCCNWIRFQPRVHSRRCRETAMCRREGTERANGGKISFFGGEKSKRGMTLTKLDGVCLSRGRARSGKMRSIRSHASRH